MASVEFGEEVRKQGQGTSLSQLNFDPQTGEFIQRPKGSSATGDVVTEMTDKGFAK
jgi:hypothetical protein